MGIIKRLIIFFLFALVINLPQAQASEDEPLLAKLSNEENQKKLAASIDPVWNIQPEYDSSWFGTPRNDADIKTIIPGSGAILGGEQIYVVKERESLRFIAAKLGVSWRKLAWENGFRIRNSMVQPGVWLRYNNRKIVPQIMLDGIIVNIPDRMLYFFKKGTIFKTASVSVGLAKDWQTPVTDFTITQKIEDPAWYVPLSIQNEMRKKGKRVITMIKPGKHNPLGKYALQTSIKHIFLHSTNAPSSIYNFNSHGCIRVFPEHLDEIYDEIDVGTLGKIIYKPVKMAVTTEGRVFLEVHKDVYNKKFDLSGEVTRLASLYRVTEIIDWERTNELLTEQSGIAEEVTLVKATGLARREGLRSKYWD